MATSTTNPKYNDARFSVLINTIDKEVKKLPALRSMGSKQRRQFTVDIAVIGLSLRTGYLVDVVAPHDSPRVFARLISGLRLLCLEFGTVTHVYEPTSEQSFFVNMPMLLSRYQPGSSHVPGVTFVNLGRDSSFHVLLEPPPYILSVLSFLVGNASALPPSIVLPHDLTRKTSIPLAAVLLDYPVAYSPESLEHPFLDNVKLDVYECILMLDKITPHTLLKFSCPSNLAAQHPHVLNPGRIRTFLAEQLGTRIDKLAANAKLQITHTNWTLDRVAL